MATLSRDLRRLYETFRAWGVGKPYPTIEAWFEFQAELKDAYVRASMLELGVDLEALTNLQQEIGDTEGKVVFLRPRRPRVVPIGDGGQR